MAEVDQYGPGRGLPFDGHIEGFLPGRYTIRIKLQYKNPASKDRYLNVGGIEVIR